MKGARYGLAMEGWPFVAALVVLAGWLLSAYPLLSVIPALLLIPVVLKFRDPPRRVPADPLGVLAPVDGVVTHIGRNADRLRLTLRVAPFGAYLLRSPTEGKVLESGRERGGHGIRIRTDEGDEVLLRLRGPEWLPSAAATGYGERIGQGQRCGVLRAAASAEIRLPPDAALLVAEGEEVIAGETVLARFAGNGKSARRPD